MTTTQAETVLHLDRTFAAPVDKVYDAMTDPSKVQQWFAPGPWEIPEIAMDVREGGTYSIVMENAQDGVRQTLKGDYHEVKPSEKLVYTWTWHRDDGASPETLVTIEFRESGGETAVNVTHDLFPNVEMRDQHLGGWNACLEQFRGLL